MKLVFHLTYTTMHGNTKLKSEDGHCQAPKHVVVPYVVDYLHASTIK